MGDYLEMRTAYCDICFARENKPSKLYKIKITKKTYDKIVLNEKHEICHACYSKMKKLFNDQPTELPDFEYIRP